MRANASGSRQRTDAASDCVAGAGGASKSGHVFRHIQHELRMSIDIVENSRFCLQRDGLRRLGVVAVGSNQHRQGAICMSNDQKPKNQENKTPPLPTTEYHRRSEERPVNRKDQPDRR